MDVLDAILSRRSIRAYMDVPVSKDVIADILLSAQMAPSSGNIQNMRYILVDDEDVKDAISDACFTQSWMKSAPVFIVIVAETSQIRSMYGARGEDNYLYQNTGAAAQNMMLTATKHNLDSCWVSAFREDVLREILDIPSTYIPTAVITLGFGSEKVSPPARFELNALVKFNNYELPITRVNWVLKNYMDEIKASVLRRAESLKETGKVAGNVISSKLQSIFKK